MEVREWRARPVNRILEVLTATMKKGGHGEGYDPPIFTVLIRSWAKNRVPRLEVGSLAIWASAWVPFLSIRVGGMGAHMTILSRILCIVGIVALAFVIFRKPQEIVTTDPPGETSQMSLSQPPSTSRARPRTQPRPKSQPADAVTFAPENQQPVYRPLQPIPAQSAVAPESQRPVYRSLQPGPGQSQSGFAAYGVGSIERASGKPVEVWGGTDDGLTIRLRDALKDAFRSSAEFHLSSGKEPGTLVITLPSNVGSQQVGGRTQVLSMAEFASSDGQNLGESKGSCWDDALAKCAAQIVKDAKIAAGKVR